MILRFFAYLERAELFEHEVDPFLTGYLKDMNDKLASVDAEGQKELMGEYKKRFDNMVAFVKEHFPYGFRKEPNHKTVPRVRFEAIAVGTAFALNVAAESGEILTPASAPADWLNSAQFKLHTRSDATNSRPKLLERLWFVRDRLLGKEPEKARLRPADEDWKNLDLF